jgi:Winged helix-turn helix
VAWRWEAAVAKRYRVTLTMEEREALGDMISRGKADVRKLAHARVLLQADASEGGPEWTDTRIAEAVRVSVRTIERVRQRFVEDGLEAALRPKPSPRVRSGSSETSPGLRRVAVFKPQHVTDQRA